MNIHLYLKQIHLNIMVQYYIYCKLLLVFKIIFKYANFSMFLIIQVGV